MKRSMLSAVRHSPKKLAITVLALGAATASVVFGSFAAWTATTSNPGNSVASGSLSFTNSKGAAAVISATNIKPGDTGSDTVTITNSGSIPLSATLTQDLITDTGFGSALGLKIHDDSRNYCYYPTPGAGACSTYGAWDGSSSLDDLAIANNAGGAKWAASEAHTFTVAWSFDSAAGNATQNQTATFRLTLDGAQ